MEVYTMDIVIESPDRLTSKKINFLQDAIIKLMDENGYWAAGGIRPYTQLDEFLDRAYIYATKNS